MRQEVEQLKQERDEWKLATEKNAQAAKLFAEKKELERHIEELQAESKSSPESLGA